MQIASMLHESQRIAFAGLPAAAASGPVAGAQENKKQCHARLSRNIYCLSIDAVIAAAQPAMLWTPLAASQAGERKLNTRAAASACRFVA